MTLKIILIKIALIYSVARFARRVWFLTWTGNGSSITIWALDSLIKTWQSLLVKLLTFVVATALRLSWVTIWVYRLFRLSPWSMMIVDYRPAVKSFMLTIWPCLAVFQAWLVSQTFLRFSALNFKFGISKCFFGVSLTFSKISKLMIYFAELAWVCCIMNLLKSQNVFHNQFCLVAALTIVWDLIDLIWNPSVNFTFQLFLGFALIIWSILVCNHPESFSCQGQPSRPITDSVITLYRSVDTFASTRVNLIFHNLGSTWWC